MGPQLQSNMSSPFSQLQLQHFEPAIILPDSSEQSPPSASSNTSICSKCYKSHQICTPRKYFMHAAFSQLRGRDMSRLTRGLLLLGSRPSVPSFRPRRCPDNMIWPEIQRRAQGVDQGGREGSNDSIDSHDLTFRILSQPLIGFTRRQNQMIRIWFEFNRLTCY